MNLRIEKLIFRSALVALALVAGASAFGATPTDSPSPTLTSTPTSSSTRTPTRTFTPVLTNTTSPTCTTTPSFTITMTRTVTLVPSGVNVIKTANPYASWYEPITYTLAWSYSGAGPATHMDIWDIL